MSKRLILRSATPVNVAAAAEAFGSELRLQLIHHFANHPGRQVDAVRALGVERAVVSLNVRALLATGVLVEDRPDVNPRSRVFTVDEARLLELLDAIRNYGGAP